MTPEEIKTKALNLAASYWGQWQWYYLRRPVLHALILGESSLQEYKNLYDGAASILAIVYGMDGSDIVAYCKSHVDYLFDGYALDTPFYSVWKNGPVNVFDEQM